MTVGMGSPEDASDDEVLEAIEFWEAKRRGFVAAKEPDAVAQAREAAEKFRAEAVKRGLIPPPDET